MKKNREPTPEEREEREARARYSKDLTRRLIDKIEELRRLNAEKRAAEAE